MSLVLHISPDKFFVRDESRSHETSNKVLIIDRLNYEISLVRNADIPVISNRKSIAGLLGILRLLSGPYLVVVTQKSKVGEIESDVIWRVGRTEIISFSRANLHLTKEELEKNRVMLDMVQQVLSTPSFYFSYSRDLTRSLQRSFTSLPSSSSFIQSADPEFLWNKKILDPFVERTELQDFCLPVIHGAVFVQKCSVQAKFFRWIIISRRSVERPGTRFFVRGVDHFGKVANFVETEQIIEHDGFISSFVQTRGSIPLFWSQLPTLKYMPMPSLTLGENQQAGLDVHFSEQISKYGDQVVINLINSTGYEGTLAKAYKEICSFSINGSRICYESFDFHAEGWDRLPSLVSRLSRYLSRIGYFSRDLRERTRNLQQSGVFRTNCMDCLDRTNVIQSLLAFENIKEVLRTLGVSVSSLEGDSDFLRVFKGVWADHADVIAFQYAGTRAMKTDFTRTGKRTFIGKINDGYNALSRYFKNNFMDGFRQDSLDLFTGKVGWEFNSADFEFFPCAYARMEVKAIHIIPLSILVGISAIILIISFTAEYDSQTWLFLLFLVCLTSFLFMMLFRFGPGFVDYPQFNKPNI